MNEVTGITLKYNFILNVTEIRLFFPHNLHRSVLHNLFYTYFHYLLGIWAFSFFSIFLQTINWLLIPHYLAELI